MNVLEKILEEIEEIYIDDVGFGVDCNLQGKSDLACDNCYECMKDVCKNIIRKHMDDATDTNVGDNDGWISVEERLPSEFDEDDDGIITVETTSVLKNGERATFIDDYDLNAKEFLTPYKVVAWRKRPEPYKPKKQD